MSHPNPIFVADYQVGLVGRSKYVAEWIIIKCSFVSVADFFTWIQVYI